ncbi:MAG: butyrate kinase [Bacillota bacterium]
MKKHRLLAINPGSTSTKIAIYDDDKPIFEKTLRHSADELAIFGGEITDQYEFRRQVIMDAVAEAGIGLDTLTAVVGRGGLLKPIPGGTYAITDRVIEDSRRGVQGKHASNLGPILAKGIADQYNLPAFFVDPPCVDEFEPLARLSGVPEIPRRSLLHALNLKAVGRRVAADLGVRFDDLNLVMVHLGGGISCVPSKKGRFVDVNNATEEGPFSPERAGTVPCQELTKLCFSGKYTEKEILRRLVGQGGMVAYLGTNNAQEVVKRIQAGDSQARLVLETMAYQIAKEIGAMATVLKGEVDYVIVTGGLAHCEMLVDWVKERVGWIAKVLVYPGEEELPSLVEGALRVLRGEEEARVYQ